MNDWSKKDALLAAFIVKIPLWPFHTWLPDAHTEAPAGGSVVLAALMLKLGIYGFIRFLMPITPYAAHHFDGLMMGLALIAIVSIGLIAIVQTDMKKLIAYSSIAHMGFAVLGCFMVYDIIAATGSVQQAYMSIEGAMVQMIAHAFSSGGLFLGVGLLQHRLHSRQISDYGGVAQSMPRLAAFMMLFALSNVGLPGTAGFVGEFMIILSAMRAHFVISAVAALTLIISAAYTLWMYQRVFFGPIIHERVSRLVDIGAYESFIFMLLSAGVIAIGVYPQGLFHVLDVCVNQFLSVDLAYLRSIH